MRAPDPTDPSGPTLQMWADAGSIARAAGDVLDTSRELTAGSRPRLSTLDMDPGWFGALPSSSALAGSHAGALVDTQAALERLVGSLENDSDGLYQVAFSVLVTDHRAAKWFGGS
jgi:hypothetical protein